MASEWINKHGDFWDVTELMHNITEAWSIKQSVSMYYLKVFSVGCFLNLSPAYWLGSDLRSWMKGAEGWHICRQAGDRKHRGPAAWETSGGDVLVPELPWSSDPCLLLSRACCRQIIRHGQDEFRWWHSGPGDESYWKSDVRSEGPLAISMPTLSFYERNMERSKSKDLGVGSLLGLNPCFAFSYLKYWHES